MPVRKHLEECHAKIHLDTTYVQHPLRKNDVSIMDLVNTKTIYKANINQKEKIIVIHDDAFIGQCDTATANAISQHKKEALQKLDNELTLLLKMLMLIVNSYVF